MEKYNKAAIVCCSNGLQISCREQMLLLSDTLRQTGLEPVFSEYIYAKDSSGICGTAVQRASALMDFYRDPEIRMIFDVSGGDMANEVLPYLDFQAIAESGKQFWGYSDLTTIINAIYTKTGKSSVLYQVRNLLYSNREQQLRAFTRTVLDGSDDLYRISCRFLQGNDLQGIVVGGNIRCLLKLAGTPYWPDMQDKILLLESLGGTVPQMVTYLSQLNQMGVFRKINGILLGTFTKMEEGNWIPSIEDMVMQYAGKDIPIAKTMEIGHGTDSKGIIIGEEYHGYIGDSGRVTEESITG